MRRREMPDGVRFLTFSCYRRLPLFGNDRIKAHFTHHLARVTTDPSLRLVAWVIMPEHIHLIVQPFAAEPNPTPGTGAIASLQWRPSSTPDHAKKATPPRTAAKCAPVTRMLYDLKRPYAKEVIARWRELHAPILHRITDKHGRPHFWQPGGGYDRNLRSDRDIAEKIDYIHSNPVKRDLCATPHDWPWSSVHAYDHAPYIGPTIDRAI